MRAIWSRKTRKELAKFLPGADPYDPQRSRTEDEMLMDVFVFNCMGSDGASGKFSLDDGELALACPDLKHHPIYATYEAVMTEMAKQMNGKFLPSPVWKGFADKKLVSVHPLGGCPMGSSADDGVVNELGQVFDANDPQHKQRVHTGLYVVDGSIVPDALAVNPTFTIMALANRIGRNALVNEPP
jgi:cholesterol oxidase